MDISVIQGVKKHMIKYCCAFILLPVINTLISIISLYIYQYSLDYAVEIFKQNSACVIFALMCYILINTAVISLTKFLQRNYISTRASEIRNNLVDKLTQSSLEHTNQIPGDILIQVQQNIYKSVEYEGEICSIIVHLVSIIGYGVYAVVIISWRALFVLLGSIICMFLFQKIVSPLRNQYQEIFIKQSYNIKIMEQVIYGIEIIKNYKMEDTMRTRYSKVVGALTSAEKDAGDKFAELHIIQHIGILVITAIISLLAALLYHFGSISSGAVVSCTLLSVLFVQTFGKLLGCIQNIAVEKTSRLQLKMVADHIKELKHKAVQNNKGISLLLKNIKYKYSNNQAGYSVSVSEVSTKATGLYIIVGMTGSGKSTLVKLLAGLLPLREGDIYIGDTKSTSNDLHMVISYSDQVPTLFPVSIYDNIAYAQNHPEIEEINKICSQYKDKIFSQHVMQNRIVGDNDFNLSGGQKQIISLCRALAKNAPIMLLDEPISAQDKYNQEISSKVIKQYSKDHLVIAVTHNLTLAEDADEVWFMEKGKIIQRGVHNILYRDCPQYRKLCDKEME